MTAPLALVALLLTGQTAMTARQGKSLDGGYNAWAVELVAGASITTTSTITGAVYVLDAGTLNVNFPATQAVSAAALPLPTGAATGAKQDTGNTSLSSIDTKTPTLISGREPVDPSGVTSPISAASLPLPSGASTSAAQTTGNSSLSNIDGKLPALSAGKIPVDIGASIVSVTGGLTDTQLRASAVPTSLASVPTHAVTGSGTFTVSGTVTANAGSGTQAVSIASMPSTPVTGAFFQTTQPVSGIDGGALATDAQAALAAAELVNGSQTVKVLNLPPAPARNLAGAAKVDGSGAVQPVSAAALPLPAGAASDATLAAVVVQLGLLTNATYQPWPTQSVNPFLQRCNPVRRTNCQP